jgi:hypothetical protein
MKFHVTFLVFLECSQQIGVHQLGLGLFGVTVWKSLVIKSFFQSKPNKSKHKTILEFGVFLVLLETFQ